MTNIKGVTVISIFMQTMATFEAPNLKEVLKECPSSNDDAWDSFIIQKRIISLPWRTPYLTWHLLLFYESTKGMVIEKGEFSLEGPKAAPISHKENIFKSLFMLEDNLHF